ncbi:MAG: hypothetical protein WEC84_01650 [Candidatus Andersenbacteria bacterium]
MKPEINLLPPGAKTGRVKRIYQRRGMRVYAVVVSGLLLVVAAYGSLWWVFERMSVVLEQPQAVQNGAETIDQVSQENTFLRAVQQENASGEIWLPLVAEALGKAPTGIKVTSIELKRIVLPTVDAEGRQMVQRALALGGSADSRTAVVDYERALQNLEWVETVEAPLRNLANGEAISFSFTLFKAKKL